MEVVHRIDDLESQTTGLQTLNLVIHRIDDLENIQRGSSNPIEFYHRSDDSKFLFQNLKRHVLSLKGRIKLIKTFSF